MSVRDERESGTTMEARSLNGGRTRPLTSHARSVLSDLARKGPIPTQRINPGVVDRFHREGLTETVDLLSPFAIHKGGKCRHEQITEAGRAAING
jgi:hypothetical protein